MALITAILGFIVGGAVFFIWGITKQRKDAVNLEAARAQAEEITKEAQTRSQLAVKEAELKAKDMVVGAKADAEREIRDRRREIVAIEQKLEAREETFEKRQEAFERREADLNRRDQSLRSREKSLTDKEEVLQAHIDEARTKLEAVAGLTREEAKHSLMDEMIGHDADAGALEHARDVDEFLLAGADHAANDFLAARTKLASDRREVLDAPILQVLRQLEPGAIARLEHDSAAMHRAQLVDLAAFGRARSRRVHHRRLKLDAAQSNRSPFHAYFLLRGFVSPQAAALSNQSAPDNFDTMTDTPILIAGAGAIGSIIGGMLRDAGHDVTLLGRRAHLEAIERGGLRISGLFGERTVTGMTLADAPAKLGRRFGLVLCA
ncbi:MAG: Rnase Y domain-containing protein, partial [Candidatus Binatus sp.]